MGNHDATMVCPWYLYRLLMVGPYRLITYPCRLHAGITARSWVVSIVSATCPAEHDFLVSIFYCLFFVFFLFSPIHGGNKLN